MFTLTQNRWKIDDVLGVWPLHGLCGAWGGIAAGIFGSKALGGVGGVAFMPQLMMTVLAIAIALIGSSLVYGVLKASRRPAPRPGAGIQRRRPLDPQDQRDPKTRATGKTFKSLHFHNDLIKAKKVCPIPGIQPLSAIENGQLHLTSERNTAVHELNRQGFLIDRLKKPVPKFAMHGHGRSNDRKGLLVATHKSPLISTDYGRQTGVMNLRESA
jgi:hypothetical protein